MSRKNRKSPKKTPHPGPLPKAERGKSAVRLNAELNQRERRALRKRVGPLQELERYQGRPWNKPGLPPQIYRDFMSGSSLERMSHKFSLPLVIVENRLREECRKRRCPGVCW